LALRAFARGVREHGDAADDVRGVVAVGLELAPEAVDVGLEIGWRELGPLPPEGPEGPRLGREVRAEEPPSDRADSRDGEAPDPPGLVHVELLDGDLPRHVGGRLGGEPLRGREQEGEHESEAPTSRERRAAHACDPAENRFDTPPLQPWTT